MRKTFSTSHNPSLSNLWLLLLRIFSGAFMLTHGYPKLLKLTSGQEIQFADPFGIGMYSSFLLVVIAEFLCSVLIIIGLGSRIASLFLIVTMAVAAFNTHASDPFGKKEMALLYLLLYVTILIFGSGIYSVDHLIAGKQKKAKRY